MMSHRDVMIVRESIEKVVSLLTRRKIKVYQRGTEAHVAYDADGNIVHVALPYIPDDATPEFIAAIQGFLDHEVAHVLFSEPGCAIAAGKKGPAVASMANLFEDTFIERRMAQEFSGSGYNLQNTQKFFLAKIAEPAIKAALAAGDFKAVEGWVSVIQARAWAGQTVSIDWLAAHPEVEPHLESFKKMVGEDLIEHIPTLSSSKECLAIAERVVTRMREAEKAREAKAREAEAEKLKEIAEAKAAREATEAEKALAKAAKSAPPPTPAAAEPEEEPPEDDDDGLAEEEREEELVFGLPSTPGTESTGEPDDLDDHTDTDAGESDDPGSISAEADDSDVERSAPSHAESEDIGVGTHDEDAGDESSAGGGDTEGDKTASSKGESTEEEVDGDAGDSDATDGMSVREEEVADMMDVMSKLPDFEKAMSERIAEDAVTVGKKSSYNVFSTEWDRIEEAPTCSRSSTVEDMDNEVRSMIGVMSKQLERAIAAQSRVGYNPGMRSGKINASSLFKTATGDDRVFRHKYERHSKRTAVTLLIDCSGSMGYADRIGVAGKAAYALSTTLERLGIDHEVLGFTTIQSSAMRAAMAADAGRGKVRYGRDQALYMPIFKGFDERLTTVAKSRIGALTEEPSYLRENPDGECVQIAARRLALRKNVDRRILMVLSDGQPACPPGNGLDTHLKQVVKEIADSGIDVIGIGIQTDAVRSYYPKRVVLHDVNELPTQVVGELSKLLLAA